MLTSTAYIQRDTVFEVLQKEAAVCARTADLFPTTTGLLAK